MKTEINSKLKKIHNWNEIKLFQAMAESLMKKTNACFVQETHNRKGFVEYQSLSAGSKVVKEISDLLIIAHSKRQKSTKICFLQAKYHKKVPVKRFLNFHADYFQWELLFCRPNIRSVGSLNFPTNILAFSNYQSISAFGVFYYDVKSKIDLLYCIPDLLLPRTVKNSTKRPSTTLQFPGKVFCPKPGCVITNNKETISTCDIDQFENELLRHNIGAPIDADLKISGFIKTLLKNVRNPDNLEIIDIINAGLREEPSSDYWYREGNPNLLIVISDDAEPW